jgi:hypothetical protein
VTPLKILAHHLEPHLEQVKRHSKGVGS